MLLCFDVSQCRKYFEMRVFENMIVNLITTVYNFLWGDLLRFRSRAAAVSESPF